MKQQLRDYYGSFVMVIFMLIAANQHLSAQIAIGARVPDLRLVDTAGESHTLRSYAGKILVLTFWSFKCPVSLAYNERIGGLQAKYAGQEVVLLGVAANANESAIEITRNADNLKGGFAIVLDPNGTLVEILGASYTPSIFILDREGILRYRGAFDNNRRVGDAGRVAFAENALDDLLTGRPVATPESKPFGCSIRH